MAPERVVSLICVCSQLEKNVDRRHGPPDHHMEKVLARAPTLFDEVGEIDARKPPRAIYPIKCGLPVWTRCGRTRGDRLLVQIKQSAGPCRRSMDSL